MAIKKVASKPKKVSVRRALNKARATAKASNPYAYPIRVPELPANVFPNKKAKENHQLAMDNQAFSFAQTFISGFNTEFAGFPGYPRLAFLATRPEYRAMAQALAVSLTREWIVLNSSETAGDNTKEKIAKLDEKIKDIGLQNIIALAAEQDCYFGKAQIVLVLEGHDLQDPLILSNKTIRKGTKFSIQCVEAMWTTPNVYNAKDAEAPDFYKPHEWWMIGKKVHSSRLMTIVTRPVPDMLKPAFNFGGMSLSQLAEPYVDNWLRTRQSVSDLVNNFSVVALKTDMGATLQDSDDGDSLRERAELFTLLRSNRGMMLLDKEREELVMLNVPISGLSQLQAQAQEQMCAVSKTPAVELLGIAPSGFGNVAEGEIRIRYDFVAALQEAFWRTPIETVINILQLIEFGEIDPDITVTFQPLYQMTPKELAEIRRADAETDGAYIDRQVLDNTEVREKLARNPESGYQGIDITQIPEADLQPQLEENEDVP